MSISAALKTPVMRTRRSTTSRSDSRTVLRNPAIVISGRGANDVVNQGTIGKTSPRRGGGKTCVGLQTRIGIDIENDRLSGGIDAEIHTRIAAAPEEMPTRLRGSFEGVVQ